MSWKKVKLGEVLYRRRETLQLEPDTEYKLITIKLYHKGVTLRNSVKGSDMKSPMSAVRAGDFVLSGIDARNGAFGIVPPELDGAIITNDFWCLEVDDQIMSKEFFLFLTSTPFFDRICKQSSDGTTQRIRLQKNKFFNYRISLPAVEEQREIHARLQDFKSNYEEIRTEFSNQLTLVKKLRQSLLQDAVQGRLVAQDGTEEPADQLLQKIKAEKAALIAAKKLKKEKDLPVIEAGEEPFDLPAGWVWCKLGELLLSSEGGKSPKCENRPVVANEWGVIKTTAVQQMQFLQNENKVLPAGFKPQENHVVKVGDLLITRAGPTNRVGIVCVVNQLDRKLILSDKTIRLSYLPELINPHFLSLALNSQSIKQIIAGKMTGMADSQVNISQDNMSQFPIPLPPLAEQKRIVAKLESVMTFCDGLEACVEESRKEAELLLQTALREALASPAEKKGQAVLF